MITKYSSSHVICPHCDYTITPDEGYFYSDEYTEQDCYSCGKIFSVSVYTKTTWTTRPKE